MGFDLTDFFETFGHDMEIAERKQMQTADETMRQWLQNAASLLLQCFDDILEQAQSLAPNDAEIGKLSGEAAVYQMLLGAVEGSEWNKTCTFGTGVTVPTRSYLPYQQLFSLFLKNRNINCTVEDAQKAVIRQSPLFHQEGHLTKDSYGRFWQHLLRALPAYEPYQDGPYALQVILENLSACYGLFHGDEDSDAYTAALQETLEAHWLEQCVCHPDGKAAEQAVRNWDVENDSYPVRSLLVAHFPEITQMWNTQELAELDEVDILGEIYPKNPKLAIKMWRLILDTAESHLTDPEAAKQLIWDTMELVWTGDAALCFIVDKLKQDEHFAKQIFQSAYVGYPQEDLLTYCDTFGERTLKAHLLELLNENPYFSGF